MRRAQLSQRERDATPRIVKALSAEGFVVSSWGWKFLPEADEWYLLVRTTAITNHGPAAVMQGQKDGLAKAEIEPDISRRVLLIKD